MSDPVGRNLLVAHELHELQRFTPRVH